MIDVEGSLPLRDYVSTIALGDDADRTGCTLSSWASFEAEGEPEDARRFVIGAYNARIGGLKRRFGS